jgi:Family of unknown function (DUF6328)
VRKEDEVTSTPTYDDHELAMTSNGSNSHRDRPEGDDGSASSARGDSAGGTGRPHRNETAAERMDRNWNELLQELRVTQTGVQILSGFLLTLPFQQRFTTLDDLQRTIFLVAVSLSTVATALLVSPVSSHRLLFRRGAKDTLVTTGDRLAKAGLVALGLTVTTVVLLIFNVVLGTTAGWVAAGCMLTFFTLNWLVLPLLVWRSRSHRTAGS